MTDSLPPTPAASDADLTGRRLGDYHLLRRLGRGGMADVYLAEQESLGRKVAFKVLKSHLAANPSYVRRFQQEAQAAASLVHANIVQIHEVGCLDGIHFMVQEYVEGQNLKQLLDRKGTLDAPAAVSVMRQVAAALHKASQQKIIHRDIKPENIMLDRSGRARILDFGLARTVRRPGDVPAPSGAGGDQDLISTIDLNPPIQGTAGYVAPEVLSGEEPNVQSDLFSLGVVAYELLAGRNPFFRSGIPATLAATLHDRPEPLSRCAPDVPPELDELVMAMLEKDRAVRPSSPELLLARLSEIERLQQGRRASEGPISADVRASISRLAEAPRRGRHVLLAVEAFRSPSGESCLSQFAERLTEGVREGAGRLPGVTLVEAAAPSAVHVSGRIRNAPATAIHLECDITDARGRTASHHRTWDLAADEIIEIRDAVCAWIAGTLELPDRTLRPPGSAPDPTAFDYYLRGRAYLRQQGRVAEAISLFEKALALDPDSPQALAGLAEAHLVRFRLDRDPDEARQAERLVQRAQSIAPDSPEVRLALGRTYVETGKCALAIPVYRQILEGDAWDFHAALGLARALEGDGRVHDAEEMLRHAARVHPDHWMAHNAAGAFYLRRGRYTDALNSFLRVVDLAPDGPRGYSNLGIAYQSLGRTEEARAAYRRSIEIGPTYSALSNLATLAYQMRDFQEAIEHYRQALAIDSHDHRVWASLAAALAGSGSPPERVAEAVREAVDRAERLREVNPNDPLLLAGLAQYYSQLRESTSARRLVERALELEPDRVDVLLMAAHVLDDLEDRAAARRALIRALDQGASADTLRGDPGYARLLADPEITERFTERDEVKGEKP